MPQTALTIGRLARLTGINVETVRYYQRIKLISEPEKPLQGYRVYPPHTITRIRFIKRAQQLGFKLDEIKELLAMGEGCCSDVRQRAEARCSQVDAQIKDLMSLRNTLNELIKSCKTGSTSSCPIVESLVRRAGDESLSDREG